MTRFRRTKAEIAAGLSPEQAKAAREGGVVPTVVGSRVIALRIESGPGVDQDYFEHIPKECKINVILDNNSFKWIDTKLGTCYNRDIERLFSDIIRLGLNEVVTKYQFVSDLEK